MDDKLKRTTCSPNLQAGEFDAQWAGLSREYVNLDSGECGEMSQQPRAPLLRKFLLGLLVGNQGSTHPPYLNFAGGMALLVGGKIAA